MKKILSNRWLIFLLVLLLTILLIYITNKILLSESNPSQLSISNSNLKNIEVSFENKKHKIYERNWQVPDPILKAKQVIVKEIESDNVFFKQKVYSPWPLASLTKLITALVVVQNVNLNTPILISTSTLKTEGEAGNLIAGEVYKTSDLLKIMLMTSSNRAARAFEEHLGKEKFLELVRKLMSEIGMTNTVIYESSGLDDNNVGTPYDIELLLEYILEKYPQILTWTRIPSLVFQPLNSVRINEIVNIDPLNERADFLGGKTGTSPKAGQNLATIIQFKDIKLGIVIMGSTDRFGDLDKLLEWIEKAYGLL